MRDKAVYNLKRCLPRMSWDVKNLYNLYRRSLGSARRELNFTKSNNTLFQQRWVSKALMRAYHGDHINENIFMRWYVPSTLPDMRPKVRAARPGDDSIELMRFLGKPDEADAEFERRSRIKQSGIAPVGSMMVAEVERRVDVFLFRCCFAHSVYEARRMVIHGSVKLNGKKVSDANTRLAPGDMVSVDPKAVRFLQDPPAGAWRSPTEPRVLPAEPEPERESEPEPVPALPIAHALPEEPVVGETPAPIDSVPETPRAPVPDPEPVEPVFTPELGSMPLTPDSDLVDFKPLRTPAPPKPEPEPAPTPDPTPTPAPQPKLEAEPTPTAPAPAPAPPAIPKRPNPFVRLTPFHLPDYAAPFLFIPAYIEVSFMTCSAIYLRDPSARPNYSEIPTPYEADGEVVRLAWEWYVMRGPRMRSKRQLAMMPREKNRTEEMVEGKRFL